MLLLFPGTGDRTVLRQVQMPIISTATCNSPEWWGGRISNAMICAGYEDDRKDVCSVRIKCIVSLNENCILLFVVYFIYNNDILL